MLQMTGPTQTAILRDTFLAIREHSVKNTSTIDSTAQAPRPDGTLSANTVKGNFLAEVPQTQACKPPQVDTHKYAFERIQRNVVKDGKTNTWCTDMGILNGGDSWNPHITYRTASSSAIGNRREVNVAKLTQNDDASHKMPARLVWFK